MTIFIALYVMVSASHERQSESKTGRNVQLDPSHKAGPETWDRDGCFLHSLMPSLSLDTSFPKDTQTPQSRKRSEIGKEGVSYNIFSQLSGLVTEALAFLSCRPQLVTS